MATTYLQDPTELVRQPMGWLAHVHRDLSLREALGGRRLAYLPELPELDAPDFLMLLAVGETIARLAVADRGRIIHRARLAGVSWAEVARAAGAADVDDVRLGYLSWVDRQTEWDRYSRGLAYDLAEVDAPPMDRRVPHDPELDLLSDEPGAAAAAAEQLVAAAPELPDADEIASMVRDAREHVDRVVTAHRAGEDHEPHDDCPGIPAPLDDEPESPPPVEEEPALMHPADEGYEEAVRELLGVEDVVDVGELAAAAAAKCPQGCEGRGYVPVPERPGTYQDCAAHPPLPRRQPGATLGLRAADDGDLSRLRWFRDSAVPQ